MHRCGVHTETHIHTNTNMKHNSVADTWGGWLGILDGEDQLSLSPCTPTRLDQQGPSPFGSSWTQCGHTPVLGLCVILDGPKSPPWGNRMVISWDSRDLRFPEWRGHRIILEEQKQCYARSNGTGLWLNMKSVMRSLWPNASNGFGSGCSRWSVVLCQSWDRTHQQKRWGVLPHRYSTRQQDLSLLSKYWPWGYHTAHLTGVYAFDYV